jgi:hypothetical protein
MIPPVSFLFSFRFPFLSLFALVINRDYMGMRSSSPDGNDRRPLDAYCTFFVPSIRVIFVQQTSTSGTTASTSLTFSIINPNIFL